MKEMIGLGPGTPSRAEMPFCMITSWQSLLSVHISLSKDDEEGHLLSALLCQQAQRYTFPVSHLIQPPDRWYMLGTDLFPLE